MRVFVASAMPTNYPYKLQKPSTVSPRVRETAECFILDSGIGDDVSNKEVLDLAHEYDADYVVAKDYLHDQERTTESVLEFLELYDDHECGSQVLIPLQPPYDEHYQALGDYSHYVLGGMVDRSISTRERIKWIRDFREIAGPGPYVHGLGVGGGIEFVSKVAGTGLLDSVDCATPEMAAINGCVLDERLRQNEFMAFKGGEGRSMRSYPLAGFNSWQIKDVWEREAGVSSTLG